MARERRMVQCLHKMDEERKGLAVGKTFRFASGDAYTVAVVNAQPKGYRGKAERKALRPARRAGRNAEMSQKETKGTKGTET